MSAVEHHDEELHAPHRATSIEAIRFHDDNTIQAVFLLDLFEPKYTPEQLFDEKAVIPGLEEWHPFKGGVVAHEAFRSKIKGGIHSWFLKYPPGTPGPNHWHPGHEYIFVLSGSQSDRHGNFKAGSVSINFPGSHHIPCTTTSGCLVFIVYEKPVSFISNATNQSNSEEFSGIPSLQRRNIAEEAGVHQSEPKDDNLHQIKYEGLFDAVSDDISTNPAFKWERFQEGIEAHWLVHPTKGGLDKRVSGGGSSGGAAILRYQPHAKLRDHEQQGWTTVVILQGESQDSLGKSTAGTILINPPGLQNSVSASEKGLICFVIYEEPLKFL